MYDVVDILRGHADADIRLHLIENHRIDATGLANALDLGSIFDEPLVRQSVALCAKLTHFILDGLMAHFVRQATAAPTVFTHELYQPVAVEDQLFAAVGAYGGDLKVGRADHKIYVDHGLVDALCMKLLV